ncbi:hypothetical protein [Pelosinus propionicus]|uniref:Uncharacterized protein n=1 Tax=Pelosinus propionicus DSM 13327 TaxID=1123291 RepID=A0A1I4N7T0_9FIRM|nr:hypothetical protein [Pelosinus propionicus]SFM11622.1 hypothetical protein SAMN04490355_104219 [Pelosinus propionicus DSM 13327]
MQLSKEELTLIEDSLRQAKQIYLMLVYQEKKQLDDAKKEIIRILTVEKIGKRTDAKIDTLSAEINKHKEELTKQEKQINKFDALIEKVQSALATYS